jgi:hypothetical protein
VSLHGFRSQYASTTLAMEIAGLLSISQAHSRPPPQVVQRELHNIIIITLGIPSGQSVSSITCAGHYSARGHFATVTALPAPAVAHKHLGCYPSIYNTFNIYYPA